MCICCLRIWMHFCSIACISACLNGYLLLSECLHCCSSIWLSFRLSAYLLNWLLVCLPGGLLGCSPAHLAASGSGSGRILICLVFCLLVCLFYRLFINLFIWRL